MKKVLLVIAIIICFTAFAVSCGTSDQEPAATTGGSAQKLTGDNVIDWGDITGTTAKKTSATTPSSGTIATTTQKTTAASTEKLPAQSWSESTDDPSGGNWSTMAPIGG